MNTKWTQFLPAPHCPVFLLTLVLLMLVGGKAAFGQIEPYAKNPWYWQYDGEPVLLVGGSDRDNISIAQVTTAETTSIFKKSYIAAWFDGPDDYKSYDVDVLIQDMQIVREQEIPKWRAFAQKMQQQGKLFCTQLHPITHMGKILEYVMNDPGMQSAVCLDFDGQQINIPWMGGHLYQGRWPGFYCTNNPRYRAYLQHQVTMFCKVGVDGIMVDDGGGAYFAGQYGGCFCKHCMAGFRQYLQEHYTTKELARLGIRDPDTFDYRHYLGDKAENKKAYLALRRQGKIPLDRDFQRFLLQSDVALFDRLQKMASKLSGKHIPFGWDNVDFGGKRASYYPIWDVFFPEINYQKFEVDGRNTDDTLPPNIVVLNKLADALNKWYTPTPAPRAWELIMRGNRTGLLQQWIAVTHANGGSMRYPRKGWVFSDTTPWYYPPKAEFEPLYGFIRKHRKLFDAYEAVQQVGVLFTNNKQGYGAKYYTPLRHLSGSLVSANIPFGIAVAGDELLANRLQGDEAQRFDVMLIPEPIRLIDSQDKIVQQWKQQGRAIAIRRQDDVAEKLRGRVQPLVALESDSNVWVFPRKIPGRAEAPLVCHVINAQYDAGSNQHTPQQNVRVRLATRLFDGTVPRKMTYYSIAKPPVTLTFDTDADGIHVTIPRVDLWGILKLEVARK